MSNPLKIQPKPLLMLASWLMLLSVMPLTGLSKPQGKLTGALIVNGTITVNDKPTVGGINIAPGSRIQTGNDGSAIVALNKLGRISIQSDTEFLLDFQENSIKGTIANGTVVINILTGTVVKISTPNGEIAIPLEQTPATLTVGVTSQGTHAFVKRDQARPISPRPSALTNSSPNKLTGELWVTGIATVNGKPAITGMTVLPGSRIQTGQDGHAVLNLGGIGRITIQPETEILLDFTEGKLDGSLVAGNIVLNIPSGVVVNILTSNGEVTVLGEQSPSTLTVDLTENDLHSYYNREGNRSRTFLPYTQANRGILGWPTLMNALFATGGVTSGAVISSILQPALNVTPIVPNL